MSFSKTLLIFNLLLLPSLALAKRCIKDILAISQSAESAVYENSTNNGDFNVSTEMATRSQLEWIIYCPEEKVEIHPFVSYRYFEFSGDNKESKIGIIDQEASLLSLGINGKTPLQIAASKFEFPFTIEINQELYLNQQDQSYRFQKYLNAKLEVGLEKMLWSKKQHSIFGSVHLGTLIGLNSNAMFGSTYRVDTQYYYRWSSRLAIALGTQYLRKDQRVNLTDLTYKGLSTNAQVVFRL